MKKGSGACCMIKILIGLAGLLIQHNGAQMQSYSSLCWLPAPLGCHAARCLLWYALANAHSGPSPLFKLCVSKSVACWCDVRAGRKLRRVRGAAHRVPCMATCACAGRRKGRSGKVGEQMIGSLTRTGNRHVNARRRGTGSMRVATTAETGTGTETEVRGGRGRERLIGRGTETGTGTGSGNRIGIE